MHSGTVTAAQIVAAAEKANASTLPVPVGTRLRPRDFLHLFTAAERKAMRESALDAVQQLREEIQTAEYIERGHPDTEAGIDALVAAGLLTADRAAKIRAFENP